MSTKSPSTNHQPDSTGSPDRWPSVIAAATVVVVVVAAVLSWVARDEEEGLGSPGEPTATARPTSEPEPTPEPERFDFRFEIRSVERVFTGGTPRPGAIRRAVRDAVTGVRETLTLLHRVAFFGVEGWRTGTYDRAVALFAAPARPSAARDLQILTLGREAGAIYESVKPTGGWLQITVLIGKQGGAATAEVRTEFRARARRPAGDVDAILSRGEYFLEPIQGEWRITGYSVRRLDHPAGETA
jgi:hypothetical protein